jgi:hypothetical protein
MPKKTESKKAENLPMGSGLLGNAASKLKTRGDYVDQMVNEANGRSKAQKKKQK